MINSIIKSAFSFIQPVILIPMLREKNPLVRWKSVVIAVFKKNFLYSANRSDFSFIVKEVV